MKKCKKCLLEKDINLFPKAGTKCKGCVSIYKKEYAILNKEKIKEYKKEYAIINKEKIKDLKKEYYQNKRKEILFKVKEYTEKNTEKIKKYRDKYNRDNPNLDYHKEYRINNKDLISLKRKEYYQKNKEKILNKAKEYNIKNREVINKKNIDKRNNNKEYYNARSREYIKNRKDSDSLYRLKCSIRTLISNSFRSQFTKKSKKTIDILGCDYYKFKEHIEYQFTSEMNWDNYATYWQLDHKIPISWSKSEEDVYTLNNYTNFQPLYWKDNISKGNRWSD